MKSITILFTLVFIYFRSSGQTTYIPDLTFENFIETTLSAASNGVANDHYVMTIPLQNVQALNFYPPLLSAINNLTGLQDFINLESIGFHGPLSSLDTIDLDHYDLPLKSIYVSDLDALKYISFGSSSLEHITFNDCSSIQELIFGSNYLADSVDFHIGYCDSLKEIDFSELSFGLESKIMIVGHNQLEHITFGQLTDTNIVEYGFHLLSNVHCIQVSNTSYFFNKLSPTQPWWPEAQHQSNFYGFSTDCTNPILGIPNLNLTSSNKEEIGVFDLLGRKVSRNQSGIVLIYFSDGSFIRTYNP